MNTREYVNFDAVFVPPKDFREFYHSLGYKDIDLFTNEDMRFDFRIIEYIKEHCNWESWGKAEYAMRGERSSDFKIGFAGVATIIEVDIDRNWYIGYLNGDVPYPIYLDIEIDKYNKVHFKKEK